MQALMLFWSSGNNKLKGVRAKIILSQIIDYPSDLKEHTVESKLLY